MKAAKPDQDGRVQVQSAEAPEINASLEQASRIENWFGDQRKHSASGEESDGQDDQGVVEHELTMMGDPFEQGKLLVDKIRTFVGILRNYRIHPRRYVLFKP